jgi:hypothetical protein
LLKVSGTLDEFVEICHDRQEKTQISRKSAERNFSAKICVNRSKSPCSRTLLGLSHWSQFEFPSDQNSTAVTNVPALPS